MRQNSQKGGIVKPEFRNAKIKNRVSKRYRKKGKRNHQTRSVMLGNGTMQNKFLRLDTFFICLAYGDLVVGITMKISQSLLILLV